MTNKEVLEFIKEANSSFKEPDACYTLSQHKGIPYYIPSGSRFLDKLISGKLVGGGYPAGKLIEIFGHPSEGKTTLGIEALKGMQKMGGISILFDTEASINRERCVAQGINDKELIIVKANTVEDVFEKLETLIELLVSKGKKGLVVWDSVAGTTTEAEEAKDYVLGGARAEHARLMSMSLRKITYRLEKSDVCLIMINQAKSNFDDPWNPATLGGEAPRFHSSVRLWVRRVGDLSVANENPRNPKDTTVTVGIKSEVRTVKNKITSPLRKTQVNIFHKTGVDEESSIINFLLEQGIAKQAGAWTKMKFGDQELSFYQKDFLEKMNTVPGLKDYVNNLIDKYDLIDNKFIEEPKKES